MVLREENSRTGEIAQLERSPSIIPQKRQSMRCRMPVILQFQHLRGGGRKICSRSSSATYGIRGQPGLRATLLVAHEVTC